MSLGSIKLKTKFAVLMVALFVASLAVNVFWTTSAQREQTETELRQQGEALAQQMTAMWGFMSENQDRFEATAFSETGSYQGLHCAIAGRSIAQLFTLESDYVTRFVNFNPRNPDDEPDAFEAEALTVFLEDPAAKEYYAITEYEGAEVFRYLAPMKIEQTCLECHGEPAGEPDVTGYPKEGWEIDDVGGAISIVIPMGVYEQAEQANIAQSVIFSLALSVATLVIIYLALSHLVTRPLGKIRDGVARVQTGDLDVQLAHTQSSAEINTLVTEFNAMTHELSEVYDGLEEQVSERTAQLEQANAVLERQRALLEEANVRLENENQYKSDFLAMMSHELRTPLTSIIAFTELLVDEGEPATEREAKARREIELNGRTLLSMINDILEMSRLDAGRIEMTLEMVDLGDVLDMVQSVVQPIADQKGLALSFDIDADVPLVEADFEKLRHTVENLASNAVKFTDEGGQVSVAVSFEPAGEGAAGPGGAAAVGDCALALRDRVCIRVTDTGIGIAEKDQQRIFEKFAQADSSTTRHYSGTGLGLSLAKEYAEMHHGTIQVESELGRGSVFTLCVPVAQPRTDDAGADDNDDSGTDSCNDNQTDGPAPQNRKEGAR